MAASNAATSALIKAPFNSRQPMGGLGASALGPGVSPLARKDSDMASSLSFAEIGQGVGSSYIESQEGQGPATPTGTSLGDTMLQAIQQRLQAGVSISDIGIQSGLADFSSAFGWARV